ncbi:type 1 glutamine amidotransferase domain-containing protein [Halpernia frigidisoli]|uniref:type 1 glutamine amidotransferase domain-containing protein n=1 Tax=Halpernia frigidisoli TaxID=1125876 RepID=UPI000B7FD68A|nr:type 1 glutamine amidotransferase domain-containing protein [Halpernia frigidisoli]
MSNLENKKVAILSADGFEQSELESPLKALKKEGAEVDIISLKSGEIKGMTDHEWGNAIKVDKTVSETKVADYDALILPGGVINPDALRNDEHAVKFVKDFFATDKLVASICHGPQTLITAEVVKGKKMTSFPSIRKDLENAGANWVDEQVVKDGNLITSRNPKDLDAFNAKIVETLQA